MAGGDRAVNDPVTQLLVIIGLLVVALVLAVRWGSRWRDRALDAERGARFWHKRSGS